MYMYFALSIDSMLIGEVLQYNWQLCHWSCCGSASPKYGRRRRVTLVIFGIAQRCQTATILGYSWLRPTGDVAFGLITLYYTQSSATTQSLYHVFNGVKAFASHVPDFSSVQSLRIILKFCPIFIPICRIRHWCKTRCVSSFPPVTIKTIYLDFDYVSCTLTR